jgi:hypothetical protein
LESQQKLAKTESDEDEQGHVGERRIEAGEYDTTYGSDRLSHPRQGDRILDEPDLDTSAAVWAMGCGLAAPAKA